VCTRRFGLMRAKRAVSYLDRRVLHGYSSSLFPGVGRGSPKEAARVCAREVGLMRAKRAVSCLDRHVLHGYSSSRFPGVGRGSPQEAARGVYAPVWIDACQTRRLVPRQARPTRIFIEPFSGCRARFSAGGRAVDDLRACAFCEKGVHDRVSVRGVYYTKRRAERWKRVCWLHCLIFRSRSL
jgi:hypothetical protein